MLDPNLTREALAWLRDLSNAPQIKPGTPAGDEWLGRLNDEMTDAAASGGELVAVAREFARKGGFFPTPGQLVEAIRERRAKDLREEREQEWRQQNRAPAAPAAATLPASAGGYAPDGWTAGRSQLVVLEYVQGLVARGHAGREQGEMYVVAMLREEREKAAAEARGETYTLPRYGPSLVGGGDLGRLLSKAMA